MTQPLLSILVPCTPDRRKETNNLLKELERQCNGIKDIGISRKEDLHEGEDMFCNYYHNGVTCTVFTDNKILTIGEKREILYTLSPGVYSWQIDSDDLLAPTAIELFINVIKEKPDVDCITFREKCMMNGEYKSSNHSLKYEKWQDNFDGFDYVRSPFYKDVIRTDIAKSVPFPKIRWNEDEQWSMALRPHLKTEYHIDEELYIYIYEPKDTSEERYGFNKS